MFRAIPMLWRRRAYGRWEVFPRTRPARRPDLSLHSRPSVKTMSAQARRYRCCVRRTSSLDVLPDVETCSVLFGAPTRSNCEMLVDALDCGDIGLLALDRVNGTLDGTLPLPLAAYA